MVQIKLPATYKEVTIKQVATHGNRELSDIHLLRIYGNLTQDEVEKLPMALVTQAVAHIKEIISAPTQAHHPIITVNGKRYGFINDWTKLTAGEYIDLGEMCKDIAVNATKIMTVLYRPITREVGKKYEIEEYKGTEGHERFNDVSAAYLYGALLFFSRIRNEYEMSGVLSLARAVRRVKESRMRIHSTTGGGGIIGCLRRWVVTLRDWMKRRNYR